MSEKTWAANFDWFVYLWHLTLLLACIVLARTRATRTALVLLLAALLLSFCARPASADRKLEEILLAVSAGADIASTEFALHNNPRAYEGNPLMQSVASRVVIKSAATVGIILLARELEKDGHPKAAAVARWTTISVWSGAAGWNIHVGMTVPIR